MAKQFLLFCLRGLGWDYVNGFRSYEARLGLIELQTLEHRMAVLGVCFVFNLFEFQYSYKVFTTLSSFFFRFL